MNVSLLFSQLLEATEILLSFLDSPKKLELEVRVKIFIQSQVKKHQDHCHSSELRLASQL
ncbi:hypothetical protein KU43_02655 [Mesotoga sp. SC_NapDC2]|nr:hypothetical protein RM69_01900 [Mesotoga sp. SC_NapDC3]PXF35262.1 hypothetical protein EU77_02770 [Mesotoga sp. SC_NapDC]RIZ61447.1 hypothetical protein KU43_02655 [Mesotoga sp. SC_NapDC2]